MADPRDANAFRLEQRDAWDSVASAWRRWWQSFEQGAQVINDRLVQLAAIRPGHRVLEIATGIGEPALTAARAVGPGGRVLATDLAPGMLALARERAAEQGLDHVEFREQDAERLDVPPASFDAALCRWGLMLMLEPTAAARSVYTALRPGARFATAVWSVAEDAPLLELAQRALRRELDLPAPDPAEPGPYRLGRPGLLHDTLAAGGFGEIEVESLQATFSFASPAEYARFVQDLSSSTRKQLATRPDDVRERVVRAIEAEAESHRTRGGHIELRNQVLCGVGRRGQD